MLPEDKYFQPKDERKIWERYCGFLDLSIGDFMQVQHSLLMEQIELVSESALAKKLLNGRKPRNVDEFRRSVPLTTYNDYEPYLSEQREAVLAEKPLYWCHSSGRGGQFKWIPYTHRGFEVCAKRALSIIILAGASRKGDVTLKPGSRMLLLMPPPPYTTGSAIYHLTQRFSMDVVPPIDQVVDSEFSERVRSGFQLAFKDGAEIVFSISSVLVKVGETMSEQSNFRQSPWSMLRPSILSRLSKAYINSRIARRPMSLRDIFGCKSIITGGTDTSIYKNEIEYYWGMKPYDVYGATETFPIALQAWDKNWLCFVPDTAFWEFIPEEEAKKGASDNQYQPATVTLDGVKEGETYELVLTHFYGMPLLRYRIGDLIKFVSVKDSKEGVLLPQMVFVSKTSDIINLAGLAEFDEKTIWQAIANAQLKYEDWCARKELYDGQSYLHIRIELKESREAAEVATMIDQQLRNIHVDYQDIENMLGIQPIKITLLSPGTFQRYYEEKQREGADLAHLKPPHMSADDSIIQRITRLSNC